MRLKVKYIVSKFIRAGFSIINSKAKKN